MCKLRSVGNVSWRYLDILCYNCKLCVNCTHSAMTAALYWMGSLLSSAHLQELRVVSAQLLQQCRQERRVLLDDLPHLLELWLVPQELKRVCRRLSGSGLRTCSQYRKGCTGVWPETTVDQNQGKVKRKRIFLFCTALFSATMCNLCASKWVKYCQRVFTLRRLLIVNTVCVDNMGTCLRFNSAKINTTKNTKKSRKLIKPLL